MIKTWDEARYGEHGFTDFLGSTMALLEGVHTERVVWHGKLVEASVARAIDADDCTDDGVYLCIFKDGDHTDECDGLKMTTATLAGDRMALDGSTIYRVEDWDNYWNNADMQVVRLTNKWYLLDGWNGERYTDCVISGDRAGYNLELGTKYELEPVYQITNIDGDGDLVGYVCR